MNPVTEESLSSLRMTWRQQEVKSHLFLERAPGLLPHCAFRLDRRTHLLKERLTEPFAEAQWHWNLSTVFPEETESGSCSNNGVWCF